MIAAPHYSLHVMLPDYLDRRFSRWAKATPGASWPDWGGHITLLPSFTYDAPLDELGDAVKAVTGRREAIELHLTELTVAQDLTREGYRAVFLAPPQRPHSGLMRLQSLRAELNEALGPLRTDRFPEITRRDYLPHITLALGLSEQEAHQMVSAARSDGLVAEFTVDRIWLVYRSPSTNGALTTQRVPFSLTSPIPSG